MRILGRRDCCLHVPLSVGRRRNYMKQAGTNDRCRSSQKGSRWEVRRFTKRTSCPLSRRSPQIMFPLHCMSEWVLCSCSNLCPSSCLAPFGFSYHAHVHVSYGCDLVCSFVLSSSPYHQSVACVGLSSRIVVSGSVGLMRKLLSS